MGLTLGDIVRQNTLKLKHKKKRNTYTYLKSLEGSSGNGFDYKQQ